jgi:hypothetical protein
MEGVMNTRALILAIVLLSGGISQAADYYIYRDTDGRTWLSNQDLREKEAPARQPESDGMSHAIAFPITIEARAMIEEAVLAEYRKIIGEKEREES